MTYYFCNTFGNTATDGIYRIEPERNGSREILAAPLKNLEWTCIAPNGILYAVGQEKSGGSYIQSFYLKQLTGELVFMEKSCFPWRGISHMSFWEQGKSLLIAVYGEQMVVSVGVEDGHIGKESGRVIFNGSGPVVDRQEASHPHFVKWMKKECWIADLGADAVYHSSGRELPGNREKWRTEHQSQGSGPRFLEIHPSGKIVYLVTELSNELIVLEKDSSGGLKEKQHISLLPVGARKSLSSILYPDWAKGRLFVGVRGANLIREMFVEKNGMIREGRTLQTLGWPRSFLYLKQLDCVLVADEEFADSTGRLELFDLCDGKRLWEKRMPRAYQVYNKEYNKETER